MKNKHNVFNVGDRAILNEGAAFSSGNVLSYVEAGGEITVTEVHGELCTVKFLESTSIVQSCALTPVMPVQRGRYRAGDKAKLKSDMLFRINDDEAYYVMKGAEVTVVKQYETLDVPAYKVEYNPAIAGDVLESSLESLRHDITEHIKTFEDARIWCESNGQHDICRAYYAFQTELISDEDYNKDILAYLKLRIITCALNEGWRPTFDDGEERWYACYNIADNITISDNTCFTTFPEINFDSACRLSFKSSELAEYAATQFKDIYMDFCYKGKE